MAWGTENYFWLDVIGHLILDFLDDFFYYFTTKIGLICNLDLKSSRFLVHYCSEF